MRHINGAGLRLIKQYEGCKLTAYVCPAGVLTIGYGSTGPHVFKGLTITADQAEALLISDLRRFEQGVENECGKATDNQFAAMVSLAFNIGLGAFLRSTVLREHQAGNYGPAANGFRLWNKGGGKILPGLVARRAAEAALYRQP